MKFVAIADSDSYLKWAAAFLGALPEVTERELILVETPVLPSAGQRSAALAVGGVAPEQLVSLPLAQVLDALRRERPDAVLVAVRGPVAAVLIRLIAELRDRPVIVTGLPGISIPATRKALAFRRQADLFVLHSRREIREFTLMSREYGWTHRFALATLPFVEPRTGANGTDLVFAAQAVVPGPLEDRARVLDVLIAAARADPTRRVVIKVRGLAGERQTHDEVASYPELLEQVPDAPANLVVSTAAMSAALDQAEGLMTVSSTAAIEAIARGIPVIALDIFGVSPQLINPVFDGSGLFGGEQAVVRRRFRHPQPAWLDDNYFHPPEADDVAAQLEALVAARRQGVLPAREPARKVGGGLRLAWDRKRAFGEADRTVSGAVALAVGKPARATLIAARKVKRAL
ncbi:MAG TPA: DUF6716 putative glycosyltransferase [Pseudolysinimonas sp.]|nr:DUF6716 putative glycosyltransferase [Pseudolysinimonas sp.]